jgi:hypothetical protein
VAIRLAAACALLLIFSVTAVTQWDKKPYTDWSEKDAQKLLDNSPWAKSTEISYSRGSAGKSNSTGGASDNSRLEMGNNKVARFRMRLISAMPMLEALNRSNLIQKPREQTIAHIRALNADNDHILISVSCDYNRIALDETGHRPKTLEEIKRVTYLEVKGGNRVFLQEYEPSREDKLGWILVFPRFVDGKPLITPESGDVRFHTEVYLWENFRFVQLSATFKAKEMIYQGKLEY